MKDRDTGGDQILFDRMAAGDESALAALYDRWSPKVYGIALWILRDADDAEDVVDETFWQAWRSAAGFDARRAAVPAWLAMIARCRALDRLRRRRRHEDLGTVASPADPSGTGVEEAERAERAERVAAAILVLPPDQRRAIELAFFDGHSHAEIADRLALPLGTVKTRIRLAMQKLREQLVVLREERF